MKLFSKSVVEPSQRTLIDLQIPTMSFALMYLAKVKTKEIDPTLTDELLAKWSLSQIVCFVVANGYHVDLVSGQGWIK